MGLLEQVQSGKKPQPRRVLLYGVAGVGKTSFGACAPDAIFMPTEDGLSDIDCASFPVMTSFDQAIAALSELYSEAHAYRTLVVDSLDWLEALIWAKVCEVKHVGSIEELGFGKGYLLAIDLWRQFLAGLSALRLDKGMMMILIAHAKVERFNDPSSEGFDRYMPRLHKAAAAVVQEWCDEVLFATYRVYTKSMETGFGQTVVKGIGTGERVLRTTERPAHMAKNRLGLPDELPFSWANYAQFLTQGV